MTEITWCKLFHDFADDAKFLRVADITGTTVELAQACFARALCRASSNPDRGSTKNIDLEEFAWWFKKPVEVIRSIFDAFERVGRMITDGHLANWAKRQGVAAAKLANIVAEQAGAAISAGAKRMRRWREDCGLSASEWAQLRERIFDRDGRKCVKCSGEEFLHCDYIVELADGGSTDPSNLQTLCRSCHSEKTSAKRSRKRPDPRQLNMMFSMPTGASPTSRRSSPRPSQATADRENRLRESPPEAPPMGERAAVYSISDGEVEVLPPEGNGRHVGRRRRGRPSFEEIRDAGRRASHARWLERARMAGGVGPEGTARAAAGVG